VYAQQCFGQRGDGDGGVRFEQQYRLSADDIKAFTDARVAALRAGLQLTPPMPVRTESDSSVSSTLTVAFRRRGEVYPRTHDMRTKAILLVMKIRRTHLF
jgi:hypothetical protein